jgi:heat shock protein HtpX
MHPVSLREPIRVSGKGGGCGIVPALSIRPHLPVMDRDRLETHKLRNLLQQAALLALLALLLGYLAWVVGGAPFVWGTLMGVGVLFFVNPVASPRLVLGMYGARELSTRDTPGLYAILAELGRRAGLARIPRLYYLPSRMINAFATGRRDDAAIVLSHGLLSQLERREVAGVLAHELGHVVNGDIQVMAFADVVSRITGILALVGQLLLVLSVPALVLGLDTPPMGAVLALLAGPTLSALVQLALSRNREYEADRTAAELSGDPRGLASALHKLERYQGGLWEQTVLPGRRLPDPSLLRTHPPTEERIARLLELLPARQSAPPLAALGGAPAGGWPGSMPRGPSRLPRWHLSGLWY